MAGFFKELIRMTGLGTSLQELLYAIIMALIFVYAARFGVVEFSGVGELLLVQTGMLVTWGVIDGIIFYYIGVCDQRRFRRLISNEEHLHPLHSCLQWSLHLSSLKNPAIACRWMRNDKKCDIGQWVASP